MYRRSREHDLTGEVVLITGGSRGLGLAMASRFASRGCRLAICARDKEELERARMGLAASGAEVIAVGCDITKRSEVGQLIEEVTAHYGRIDILVTNAGQIQVGPIESVVVEDFEDAMNVMFWGTVYPTLALLPTFLERNSGRIVNITSIGGKVAVPHMLPYASAKFAATGFSEGLRNELSATGVKVTTIAPGLMRTGSYNAAHFKGDQEAEAAWFSLGASLPGFSMDADRAARQIVQAVQCGDTEKILTIAASLLAHVNGIAPSLTSAALGAAGALLLPKAPSPASTDSKHSKPGWGLANLQSPKMRALLFLGRMSARRFNQKYA
ncbi:MAG: SDR family NAD(P)-dependent oxidoreductase [Acidobacteriota bacterium]|nr:SDR family NAD(P)-dependent oxidoreductase [Acidobacteriota bacterium]